MPPDEGQPAPESPKPPRTLAYHAPAEHPPELVFDPDALVDEANWPARRLPSPVEFDPIPP